MGSRSGRHRTRKPLYKLGVALALCVSLIGLVFTVDAAFAGPGLTFPVMNTSEYPPDGVYFRTAPDWNAPDRTPGFGVFRGESVRVKCWTSGTNVPRRDGGTNTVWYSVDNVSRTTVAGRSNSGWLNAHFVNDGARPNEAVAGAERCDGGGQTGGGGGGTGPVTPPTAPVFTENCPENIVIAVPGSGETTVQANPIQSRNGIGMLGNVTRQLAGQPLKVRVVWVPYPSQITGTWDDATSAYWMSKNQGYSTAYKMLTNLSQQCGQSKFVLLGYSQGGHIAGDLAATIKRANQPIAASKLVKVLLLGDAARDGAYQNLTGTSNRGGNGIAGHRGSNGVFDSKVVTEYCIAHDPICDSNVWSGWGRALGEWFKAGPHRSYNTTSKVPGTNTTFTDRMAADLRSALRL